MTMDYDAEGQLPDEERDGANSVTKRFYAEGQVNYQPSTLNLYYTRDHLGSVREVTDNSGTVRARYDYDPYGRVTKVSGDVDSDFLYTGHYYHARSGLHLAMYRAYDADLGRWLNRDPIGEAGGINLYGYVGNNPVNWIDPLGLLGFGTPGYSPKPKPGKEPETPIRAFGQSLAESIVSIPAGFFGALFGDDDLLDAAYDMGPLGQSSEADGFTYYGTRICIGTATVAVSAAVAVNAAGISTRLAAHGSHHSFGPLGRLPHVQLNWWRAGVKGSGGAVRIPVPPRTPGFPP